MTWDEFERCKVYVNQTADGWWWICAPEPVGLWFWTM